MTDFSGLGLLIGFFGLVNLVMRSRRRVRVWRNLKSLASDVIEVDQTGDFAEIFRQVVSESAASGIAYLREKAATTPASLHPVIESTAAFLITMEQEKYKMILSVLFVLCGFLLAENMLIPSAIALAAAAIGFFLVGLYEPVIWWTFKSLRMSFSRAFSATQQAVFDNAQLFLVIAVFAFMYTHGAILAHPEYSQSQIWNAVVDETVTTPTRANIVWGLVALSIQTSVDAVFYDALTKFGFSATSFTFSHSVPWFSYLVAAYNVIMKIFVAHLLLRALMSIGYLLTPRRSPARN